LYTLLGACVLPSETCRLCAIMLDTLRPRGERGRIDANGGVVHFVGACALP
jgi:hypothetical protein